MPARSALLCILSLFLAPLPALEVGMKEGQLVPDFVLPTVDGQQLRLSDLRGKKLLLFNFASW